MSTIPNFTIGSMPKIPQLQPNITNQAAVANGEFGNNIPDFIKANNVPDFSKIGSSAELLKDPKALAWLNDPANAETVGKLSEQGAFDHLNKDGDFKTDKSWFSGNKDMINTGISIGKLGLGIADYLSRAEYNSAQTKLAKANTTAVRQNTEQAKKEFNRLNKLRKHLTSSYASSKPAIA